MPLQHQVVQGLSGLLVRGRGAPVHKCFASNHFLRERQGCGVDDEILWCPQVSLGPVDSDVKHPFSRWTRAIEIGQAGQGDFLGFLGTNAGARQVRPPHAVGRIHRISTFTHDPLHAKVVKAAEELVVAHHQPLLIVRERHRDRRLQVLAFRDGRVGNSVWEHQPVDTELSVIRRVAKVAAVQPIRGSVCFFPQPLVDPIPNEAALKVWIGVEGVPVLVDVSGAVPHGMTVLAENDRPILLQLRDLVDPSIHGADDVRRGGPAPAALVLDRPRAVKVPDPASHACDGRSVSRLVP
mmetsp:Transcript_34367/g.74430  ORF Transcript_34367/g.74430 Transcript_34367/m.74430 type:complete len:295 (+) Transcript_34367:1153-2037(+)